MHIRILNTKKEKITTFKIGDSIASDLKKLNKENLNTEIRSIATVFLKPDVRETQWTWEKYTPANEQEVVAEEAPATEAVPETPAVEASAQTES